MCAVLQDWLVDYTQLMKSVYGSVVVPGALSDIFITAGLGGAWEEISMLAGSNPYTHS